MAWRMLDVPESTSPCQALADLMTIQERLGRLSSVPIAYVGDGNSVCRSLMRGAAIGLRFIAATPPDRAPEQDAIDLTRRAAIQQGGTVQFTTDALEAADRAEVLYTSPWSAGQVEGYRVDEEALAAAELAAFVMHSRPDEHWPEIAEGVLRGPRSAAWDQAENRLHVQKALLALVVR